MNSAKWFNLLQLLASIAPALQEIFKKDVKPVETVKNESSEGQKTL